jgi:hypothetical protein
MENMKGIKFKWMGDGPIYIIDFGEQDQPWRNKWELDIEGSSPPHSLQNFK